VHELKLLIIQGYLCSCVREKKDKQIQMKNTIPWKSTIDINTTRNLFSLACESLPYEIELYICSCGWQKTIIKHTSQESQEYKCRECGNETFYDAAYYFTNYAWYDPIEKMPFYDLLQENLMIEIKYDADANDLHFLLNLQIPNSIDLSSQKIGYHPQALYSLLVNKYGNNSEELMVRFDFDSLIDERLLYLSYPSQSDLINKHPMLTFFKKQMLQLLIKHPLCDNLALVKYDCTSIKDISFFLAYSHLKEYRFIAWQEAFLLPEDKPLTIKQALAYVINYRKEKSLQKALFEDYEKQIRTTQKYHFYYINSVCKYIPDVNIAKRMVTLKFEDEFAGNHSYVGAEKLFAYLAHTYTQKQIESLINEFSHHDVYMFFDTLEMFSQFEDEMMQMIEKAKPKCYEFHNAIVSYHRLAVAQKLFHASFEYSVQQKRGCVIKEPYSVQLPQNGLELYEWSVALQNCLSGYGELIKNKRTTVYGFFRDSVLHIAVEVKNNQIVQASSKYNQKISREDADLIHSWFDELLKLTNSSYSDTISQIIGS